MRIKTQFFVTMIIFGVTLVVIGTSLMATVRQMSHLDEQEELAVAISRGASDLSYLSSDYLLYREDQQRERWESRWTSVSNDVARLTPATPEERAIRDHITANLARVKAIFGDIEPALEGASEAGGGLTADALFQISWSRLAVQNQSTSFEALRLTRVLREQKALVSQRNVVLVSVMLALFAVYFVTNYMIVYRRGLRAVAQLRAGTRIVGAGNLDYAIPVTQNDEIGDLSRAFNRMTVDLKGVTGSKAQLEREVAEREKAEASLRYSLHRIEELSDSRERELETTKLLLEAAEALAEWTDLGHVLEALADVALASTAHKRVTVLMWDEVRRELHVVVIRGDSAGYPIEDVTTWDELSGPGRTMVETMSSQVIDFDALPQGRAAQLGARLGLAVPLVYRQQLVGVVRVDDPGERREFDEREIALIQGLAAQAAVAIENARLYEDERRVADALRSTFQRPVPDIAGVSIGVVGHYASQAERVGGDFYDAFAIGGEVAVLVGDVAGKGLAAVGLTERVRTAVRTLAYAGGTLSPSYLLSKVNESLVEDLLPGEFVTAILLAINPSTGSYRIARAGHPLPVICGETCSQVQTPSGPPLGVIESPYEELSGVIAANETVVLYTDGVTEARRDRDFYGDDRLLAALSRQGLEPAEIAHGLFTDVHEFARERLADDLLIVAVRRSTEAI